MVSNLCDRFSVLACPLHFQYPSLFASHRYLGLFFLLLLLGSIRYSVEPKVDVHVQLAENLAKYK